MDCQIIAKLPFYILFIIFYLVHDLSSMRFFEQNLQNFVKRETLNFIPKINMVNNDVSSSQNLSNLLLRFYYNHAMF